MNTPPIILFVTRVVLIGVAVFFLGRASVPDPAPPATDAQIDRTFRVLSADGSKVTIMSSTDGWPYWIEIKDPDNYNNSVTGHGDTLQEALQGLKADAMQHGLSAAGWVDAIGKTEGSRP